MKRWCGSEVVVVGIVEDGGACEVVAFVAVGPSVGGGEVDMGAAPWDPGVVPGKGVFAIANGVGCCVRDGEVTFGRGRSISIASASFPAVCACMSVVGFTVRSGFGISISLKHICASSYSAERTASFSMAISSRLGSSSSSSFRNARLQPVQYLEIPGSVMARKVKAQRSVDFSFENCMGEGEGRY